MNKRVIESRLIMFGCLLLAAAALVSGRTATTDAAATSSSEQFETRCGWFSNPTPANASLHDRQAEWIIGVQGGYQAEGDWPDFSSGQWVETNGHYGYGCACMRVRVDRRTQRVIEIESARVRPLSVCRRDRSLRRWGFK